MAPERCQIRAIVRRLRGQEDHVHPWPRSSEEIQIDHLVPLACAWDAGAWSWSDAQRHRFYFDPAELLAVDGPTNQAEGDGGPDKWMPPNAAFDCQYAIKFTSVLRAHGLPIDPGSATAVQQAC